MTLNFFNFFSQPHLAQILAVTTPRSHRVNDELMLMEKEIFNNMSIMVTTVA